MSEVLKFEAVTDGEWVDHDRTWSLGELAVRPIRPDYASLSVVEGFDWTGIIHDVRRTRQLENAPLYLVAFRSLLKPDANRELLARHDYNAHMAALESPSLIHYFADVADESGLAQSFCLWENARIARELSRHRSHRAAAAMVSEYVQYSIETFDVFHTEDPVRLTLRETPSRP